MPFFLVCLLLLIYSFAQWRSLSSYPTCKSSNTATEKPISGRYHPHHITLEDLEYNGESIAQSEWRTGRLI
ncbi:hypothetical protein DL95DRAFT_152262 [Leptodontidium sp. 2 PMI_412]|nr:hypothetical protein DL95DRAFT_152262 [Leptodontidium sp. 2 PMI_412]